MNRLSWDFVPNKLRAAAGPARAAMQERKSVLLVGGPGCERVMVAQRLPLDLPQAWIDKLLAVSRRMGGMAGLNISGLTEPPFRAPHYTVSIAGMVGNSERLLPGELSLAHGGVLFLDNAPEFTYVVLSTVGRAQREGKVEYNEGWLRALPAEFVLVAAAMPCPCGWRGGTTRECTCTDAQVERYLGRMSALHLEVRVDLPAVGEER